MTIMPVPASASQQGDPFAEKRCAIDLYSTFSGSRVSYNHRNLCEGRCRREKEGFGVRLWNSFAEPGTRLGSRQGSDGLARRFVSVTKYYVKLSEPLFLSHNDLLRQLYIGKNFT